MGAYRFIVAVDLEASSLEEGYAKLLGRMGGQNCLGRIDSNDWESTDEAYMPDGDNPIPRKIFDEARLRVLSYLDASR